MSSLNLCFLLLISFTLVAAHQCSGYRNFTVSFLSPTCGTVIEASESVPFSISFQFSCTYLQIGSNVLDLDVDLDVDQFPEAMSLFCSPDLTDNQTNILKPLGASFYPQSQDGITTVDVQFDLYALPDLDQTSYQCFFDLQEWQCGNSLLPRTSWFSIVVDNLGSATELNCTPPLSDVLCSPYPDFGLSLPNDFFDKDRSNFSSSSIGVFASLTEANTVLIELHGSLTTSEKPVGIDINHFEIEQVKYLLDDSSLITVQSQLHNPLNTSLLWSHGSNLLLSFSTTEGTSSSNQHIQLSSHEIQPLFDALDTSTLRIRCVEERVFLPYSTYDDDDYRSSLNASFLEQYIQSNNPPSGYSAFFTFDSLAVSFFYSDTIWTAILPSRFCPTGSTAFRFSQLLEQSDGEAFAFQNGDSFFFFDFTEIFSEHTLKFSLFHSTFGELFTSTFSHDNNYKSKDAFNSTFSSNFTTNLFKFLDQDYPAVALSSDLPLGDITDHINDLVFVPKEAIELGENCGGLFYSPISWWLEFDCNSKSSWQCLRNGVGRLSHDPSLRFGNMVKNFSSLFEGNLDGDKLFHIERTTDSLTMQLNPIDPDDVIFSFSLHRDDLTFKQPSVGDFGVSVSNINGSFISVDSFVYNVGTLNDSITISLECDSEFVDSSDPISSHLNPSEALYHSFILASNGLIDQTSINCKVFFSFSQLPLPDCKPHFQDKILSYYTISFDSDHFTSDTLISLKLDVNSCKNCEDYGVIVEQQYFNNHEVDELLTIDNPNSISLAILVPFVDQKSLHVTYTIGLHNVDNCICYDEVETSFLLSTSTNIECPFIVDAPSLQLPMNSGLWIDGNVFSSVETDFVDLDNEVDFGLFNLNTQSSFVHTMEGFLLQRSNISFTLVNLGDGLASSRFSIEVITSAESKFHSLSDVFTLGQSTNHCSTVERQHKLKSVLDCVISPLESLDLGVVLTSTYLSEFTLVFSVVNEHSLCMNKDYGLNVTEVIHTRSSCNKNHPPRAKLVVEFDETLTPTDNGFMSTIGISNQGNVTSFSNISLSCTEITDSYGKEGDKSITSLLERDNISIDSLTEISVNFELVDVMQGSEIHCEINLLVQNDPIFDPCTPDFRSEYIHTIPCISSIIPETILHLSDQNLWSQSNYEFNGHLGTVFEPMIFLEKPVYNYKDLIISINSEEFNVFDSRFVNSSVVVFSFFMKHNFSVKDPILYFKVYIETQPEYVCCNQVECKHKYFKDLWLRPSCLDIAPLPQPLVQSLDFFKSRSIFDYYASFLLQLSVASETQLHISSMIFNYGEDTGNFTLKTECTVWGLYNAELRALHKVKLPLLSSLVEPQNNSFVEYLYTFDDSLWGFPLRCVAYLQTYPLYPSLAYNSSQCLLFKGNYAVAERELEIPCPFKSSIFNSVENILFAERNTSHISYDSLNSYTFTGTIDLNEEEIMFPDNLRLTATCSHHYTIIAQNISIVPAFKHRFEFVLDVDIDRQYSTLIGNSISCEIEIETNKPRHPCIIRNQRSIDHYKHRIETILLCNGYIGITDISLVDIISITSRPVIYGLNSIGFHLNMFIKEEHLADFNGLGFSLNGQFSGHYFEHQDYQCTTSTLLSNVVCSQFVEVSPVRVHRRPPKGAVVYFSQNISTSLSRDECAVRKAHSTNTFTHTSSFDCPIIGSLFELKFELQLISLKELEISVSLNSTNHYQHYFSANYFESIRSLKKNIIVAGNLYLSTSPNCPNFSSNEVEFSLVEPRTTTVFNMDTVPVHHQCFVNLSCNVSPKGDTLDGLLNNICIEDNKIYAPFLSSTVLSGTAKFDLTEAVHVKLDSMGFFFHLFSEKVLLFSALSAVLLGIVVSVGWIYTRMRKINRAIQQRDAHRFKCTYNSMFSMSTLYR
ncbi:hypothetical protein P9112_005793 [Eukaryota sp. TZLM1-RC]